MAADATSPTNAGAAETAAGAARPVPEEQKNWAIFPGVYHPYGRGYGGEFSLLYRGAGIALGGEGKTHYAEAEIAAWLISLGAGVRQEGGRGRSTTATQWTLACPLLPVFPYARWQPGFPGQPRFEGGIMIKIPLFNVNRLEGVL